jgi:hypothetical protein
MDVIKQRLQVQRKQGVIRYKGSFDALVSILREDGVRGLFRVCCFMIRNNSERVIGLDLQLMHLM